MTAAVLMYKIKNIVFITDLLFCTGLYTVTYSYSGFVSCYSGLIPWTFLFLSSREQWSNGRMLAQGLRGPGFDSHQGLW